MLESWGRRFKMPRPKLNPTEEQRRMVKTMAAMGGKQEEIAMKIGIHSPKTLRKYFRNEIDQGASEANMTIVQALYKKAKEGNVAALIFWLKCRAGWCEREGFETTSPPSAPFI